MAFAEDVFQKVQYWDLPFNRSSNARGKSNTLHSQEIEAGICYTLERQ